MSPMASQMPASPLFAQLSVRRRSKKTSKLRVTGLCAGISPVTCEFPAQKASNAENISIWWRHHMLLFQTVDLMDGRKGPMINVVNCLNQLGFVVR